MSLINDALKRASQAEKARAARPQPAAAMQPAGRARPRGPATGLIFGGMLALVLGCSAWFFWHWWNHRAPAGPGRVVAGNNQTQQNVAPPVGTTTSARPVATITPPATTPVPKTTVPKTNASLVGSQSKHPPNPNPLRATNKPVFTVVKTNPAPTIPAATPLVQVTPPVPQVVTQVVTHVITQVVAQVSPPPVNPPANVTPTVPPPPPPPKAVEFPPLQVQGIFYREKNPSALINGRTVFVGDHLGDVKVLAIEPKAVKVELEGVTKTLWL